MSSVLVLPLYSFALNTVLQRIRRLTRPTVNWKPSYVKYGQTIANISSVTGDSATKNGSIVDRAATSYGSNDGSIRMEEIASVEATTGPV